MSEDLNNINKNSLNIHINEMNQSNPFSPINPLDISNYQNISPSQMNNRPLNIVNTTSMNFEDKQVHQNEENFNSLQDFKFINEPETPKMNINIFQNTSQMDVEVKKKQDNECQSKTKITNTETENSTFHLSLLKKNPIIPTIQNMVVTADLSCNLNLRKIALQAINTYYDPKKFSGLVMRIKEPKTTALIFCTGKIVVLGAKTEEDSKKACRTYAKIIKSLGFKVFLKNIQMQNIVGSCDIKFKIPLTKLYFYMMKFLKSSRISYEPEMFPGLIYRYISEKSKDDDENKEKEPNIVFLIFSSGKIVIAGGRNRNQIYNAFNKVYTFLYQFKEKNNLKNEK